MAELELRLPAKLNLFLQVVGRRADGYHLLQTVFQLIDLCDELRLGVRADGELRLLSGAAGVEPADDLALRAAQALRDATGCAQGADILLHKRIPMGGGLGGGSSDAAGVLLGLNTLWGCGLGPDALAALGLGLGADVPVFVHGHSAWAEGVGERLQPLALGSSSYLVLDSGVQVPTAALFQAPELTRDAPPATIAGFARGEYRSNVFQPVLLARSPAAGAALEALGDACAGMALQMGLSGTGGCFFARFERATQAEAAQARLGSGRRSWVVDGLDRSPVFEQLAQAA
ncbi:MAG: 4-(cytidine 5'-diphospho)-2-C-methyl-D-erythritol kinase [Aquimonas sp.]|nr:4-(cytidine 5'-diphospho)-2-C-methyl-D-erythritol kinase [Aquimonas sp.]